MPSRSWLSKRNDDGTEEAGLSEEYKIGEFDANIVYLNQVPKSTTVTISGYTEISSGSPTAGQFLVDYDGDMAGKITFHADDNGKKVTVAYTGLGTMMFAAWLNALQSYKADDVEAVTIAGQSTGGLREAINQANVAGLVV